MLLLIMITVQYFAGDVAVPVSDISNICMGPPVLDFKQPLKFKFNYFYFKVISHLKMKPKALFWASAPIRGPKN